MNNIHSVCICGGGGLGHTIAANISSHGYEVNLLTGHPQQWSNKIEITDCNMKTIIGNIHRISNKPEEVIPSSDIVLLCVPGYLIQSTIQHIAPYITNKQEIGSVVCSNGFFWIAAHELGNSHKLFGFQRVPYISRVKEYGKSAELKGYKSLLKIGGNKHSDLPTLSDFFTKALGTQTIPLGHYLEATLTNSNPLLHPARIYGMLSPLNTELYDREFLFYEEWDDLSSEILIKCDQEFQQILKTLPIQQKEIPSILQYYESDSIEALTQKLRSIPAFKGIKMEMRKQGDQFVIDYNNRYFTEDIPFGLLIIKSLAILTGIDTPTIDQVISWMQEKTGKQYLINGSLTGKDIKETGVIQNFGINTAEQLCNL